MNTIQNQQPQQQDGFFIKEVNVGGKKVKITCVEWRGGNEWKYPIECSKTPDEQLLEALNAVVEEAKEAAGAVWMDAEVVGILLRTPEAQGESSLKITIRGTVTDGNPAQSLT